VEAAGRLFQQIWIDETTTAGGRQALGWYHEKRDEMRGIGLGPAHDWSSHCADAFGLMCVAYEAPSEPAARRRPRREPRFGPDAWMG
jgi:phage terminase large subunit